MRKINFKIHNQQSIDGLVVQDKQTTDQCHLLLHRAAKNCKVNDSDSQVASVFTFKIVRTPLPDANKKRVKSPWCLPLLDYVLY